MRAILTYHSIDDSGSPISVKPSVFRAQVAWLTSGRVRVVSVADVLRSADEDCVALTFDDGFMNLASEAAPCLLEHRLPFTVYIVSEHVGQTNAWGGRTSSVVPTLPLLGWKDLELLQARGVEIGGHTRRHPHLSRCSPEQVTDEVEGCAEDIASALGKRPRGFAYPYGDYNGSVVASARRVFDTACTTELRTARAADDRLRLPRLDMYYFRHPGQLESWGTATFAARLWARAQARRVRGFATRAGWAA